MSTVPLECRDLTLNYGNGTVIGPIQLKIEPGLCVALVGPNGAGKTSLLHMILGLRGATRGEAITFGMPTCNPQSREGVGYLQETAEFPDRMHAYSLLLLHCQLTGACDFGKRDKVETYLETFGIEMTRKPLRLYSKGMKQRLALAIAMLDCRKLLILDEPNSGLDPIGIAMLRQKLESAKRQGCTILLSTHRLAESMVLADRVVVLNKGQIVGDEPMSRFPEFDLLERFFLGCLR